MFNEEEVVVGITYDGEWTVSFIFADAAGRPASELPVRVGRGVANFLRESVHPEGGAIVMQNKVSGAWQIHVTEKRAT